MTTPMHWARWGDPAHAQPLSDEVKALVTGALGASGEPDLAVEMSEVRMPERELPAPALTAITDVVGAEHVLTDHETRVRHTRGKSTPDLMRIRAGDGAEAPDAVVLPGSHDEVQGLIEVCVEHRIAVVPFGGGTSVVGGLATDGAGFNGVIALDVSRLNRLVELDTESQIAYLEPGLLGPAAEALLAERGYTIGHFPQSFEYASIGGFAAARSSGQSSAGYGRFDANVVTLTVATPVGTLQLGSSPANAAGPDLRQVILGSEGAFGVITQVGVRVRPVPAVKVYEAWRFASFAEGAAAMRTLIQEGTTPTVLRLSDETETFVNLAQPDAIGADDAAAGCLMITGYEGTPERTQQIRGQVTDVLAGLGGESLGEAPGEAWAAGRFHGPYLRDSMLDSGVLVETFETVTFWSNLSRVYDTVRQVLTDELTGQGTPPMVLCHISHIYPTGASLYFTVACKKAEDALTQWGKAKGAVTAAMVEAGASVSHHHGVGRDHKPWLAGEIGSVGVEILQGIKERLDPTGILNPGVLIP